MRNILNLVGKNSLLGHLAAVAQQLNVQFHITPSEQGRLYIHSLSEIFEFGMGLHPDVGFCYPNSREAEQHTFQHIDNKGKFVAMMMDISRSEHPLCLFNHLGQQAWTYVFVLLNPADIIPLFRLAKPCDYFLSNTQGQFMLAANWHHFSLVHAH